MKKIRKFVWLILAGSWLVTAILGLLCTAWIEAYQSLILALCCGYIHLLTKLSKRYLEVIKDQQEEIKSEARKLKKVFVVTRSEEHCDYVEAVFTNEKEAKAYCKPFNEDEDSYNRYIDEIELSYE